MTTAASKPVVLMAEKLAPSTLEVFGDEVEIRTVDGTDRPALLEAVATADALLVRSATQVDAEVFDAAKQLKIVGRAGVGLDNVEVPAATAHGVMVVNAPTSNIVSAAEHALALLLATARRIPEADASLRAGKWERSKLSGVEIQGKTVGVIGLGKIGQLFASRIASFGTHVIAYDPYLPQSRATQLGIELVELDELLARADMMTIHLPKTPETQGLIGKEALAKTKPGVIIINAARGGLVDEEALAEAVRSGHVAGAGVDVYVTEPTTSSPLFELPRVTVTPHLGASTAEAQDRAGTDVAHSVLAGLRGDFVPDAVNVSGGAVGEEVRPWLGITQKLGVLLSDLVGAPRELQVLVRGELAHEDVSVLSLAALRGVFGEVVDEPVTFVNAPALAEERGVSVAVETESESPNHRSMVTLRAVREDGDAISVSGTLTGEDEVEKLVEINGRSFDLRAEGDVLLFEYSDRPGAMGVVGTMLGESDVNIEAAQLSQTRDKSSSIMLLRVDQPVATEVLEPIGATLGARTTRLISFG
ncbi:phosphoglycerate dehydrogenase [Actinomycetospora sp. CA-053990]|uniref:phosphoglycerate dehydrogenase n=1 Tax=Actinomycetospora sp. CA-053990 TaxID=3239891 RepID=UPI003D8DA663